MAGVIAGSGTSIFAAASGRGSAVAGVRVSAYLSGVIKNLSPEEEHGQAGSKSYGPGLSGGPRKRRITQVEQGSFDVSCFA